MAIGFVPEGQHDRRQARSAWNHEENGPRPSGTIEPILLTLGLTMTSTVPPGRSRFRSIPEALRAWLLSCCPSGTKAIQFLINFAQG
jgi:hypothetical protein